MKKLYVILVLICISFINYSQDCNYFKNEVDEFTGKKRMYTNLQTIINKHEDGKTHMICLSLNNINGAKFVKFVMFKRHSSSRNTYCFNKGSKLLIKLKNNEVIELRYIGDVDCAESDYNYSQYGSYTDYTISGNFYLDKESIIELNRAPINKFRVYFTDGYVDLEVEGDIKNKLGSFRVMGDKEYNVHYFFMNTFKCIE